MNELVKMVEESNLDANKADILKKKFNDFFDMAGEWEARSKQIIVTDESQTALMKMAREGRLFLRSKRIEIENTRKEMKEQSLREGKAIDGIANVLKALIVPIEEHLDAQEHFIEIKQKHEEDLRQQEAERLLKEKEEADRLERIEEEKRIRAENERLRKEAEARELAAKKEREEHERKLAEERRIAEQKAQEEKAKADKVLAEERRIAAEKADVIRKEAEARELAVKKEFEAKMEAQRIELSKVTCPECGHRFVANKLNK
jgi:hypothetical protein